MNSYQLVLDKLYSQFNKAYFSPYLLKNHNKLFKIAYGINDIYQEAKENTEIDEKDLIKLEEKFLSSLKVGYKYKFKKDYKNKKIIRVSGNTGTYKRDRRVYEYQIEFPEKNHIDSLIILSHEYMHHLSSKFPKIKQDTSAYQIYSEMLSILGELKCLDFLREYITCDEEIEIYKKNCRTYMQPIFNYFLFTEPLLELYLSKEIFLEKQIEELLETNPYYKRLGKKIVLKNIVSIANGKEFFIEQDIEKYTYILGLAEASFLHQQNISNKDFVKLIEKVNTVEIEEFEELLPKMNEEDLVYATKKEYCYKKEQHIL